VGSTASQFSNIVAELLALVDHPDARCATQRAGVAALLRNPGTIPATADEHL
jgi:hypothetical protein